MLIGGSMGPVTRHLFSDQVQLLISEKILQEVADVGQRGHLRRYFDQDKLSRFIGLLRQSSIMVPDVQAPPQRSRDPDDDYVLAVCKAGRADVLLTGDKDLLVLKHHHRTTIMTVGEFRRTLVH
jgi:hypothetical protein